MYDNTSRVIEVDINEILPNRFQPRIQFDEEEILELSDSIKEHGIIQPLVVRTIGDKYEIIAGERRYKASVLAGKETVPIIIKELNDKESAEIALIENVQRKNLTPIEEALSYKKIMDMGYITQDSLASKLGKSQSSIANKIRLLNLSDDVQEALLENKISERHARSLLKLSSTTQQNEMLKRIINERLTVRKTDEEISKIKNDSSDIDDSKKLIEKGEIDMNNNNFGMTNIPQNQPQPSMQNFDIFGSNPVLSGESNVQTFENVNTMPQMPTMGEFGFNTNLDTSVAQSVNPMVDLPNIPFLEPENSVSTEQSTIIANPSVTVPSMPQMPTMGEFGFNTNLDTSVAQSVNPMVDLPNIPFFGPENPVSTEQTASIENPSVTVSSMPQIPTMGEFGFNTNLDTSVAQSVNPMVDLPNIPFLEPENSVSTEQSESPVPFTTPIIESPVTNEPSIMNQESDSLFTFGDNNINSGEQPQSPSEITMPEFKIPEPIIITDYSKQYDPIMPEIGPVEPTVDFKEVINAIRDCSKKIEQYGFKLDVEEYNLENLYQVIFKIEK